ncbi:hypothetical protein BDA96_01G490700 [Sorghum bicolor]|jgi:hypothetical protein|uniref:Uncharacterized protein n=1 Tax=Sorghum bicolor TaxID=4558 RepID=A0A921S6C6_SORBI|nr:hypothetical protein BDA96_01G490700 [Sorghum bicolor]
MNANRTNDSEQQQQHTSNMHMARKDAIVEPEKEAESSPLPSKTWHPREKEAQISALPSHADPADAGRQSSLPVPAEPRTAEETTGASAVGSADPDSRGVYWELRPPIPGGSNRPQTSLPFGMPSVPLPLLRGSRTPQAAGCLAESRMRSNVPT